MSLNSGHELLWLIAFLIRSLLHQKCAQAVISAIQWTGMQESRHPDRGAAYCSHGLTGVTTTGANN